LLALANQLRTELGKLWLIRDGRVLRRFWPVAAALVAVLLALWAAVAIPPQLIDTRGLGPSDRLRAANDLRVSLLAMLGGIAVIAGAIVAALNVRGSSRQRRAAEDQNRAVLDSALEQNRALLEQGRAVLEQNRAAQEQAQEQVRAAHEQAQEQAREGREQAQEQARAAQKQSRAALDLQRRGQMTERFTRAIEQLGQGERDRLELRIGAAYALEQIARDSAELHWPVVEVLTAHLRVHVPVRPAAAAPEVAAAGPPIGGVLTAYLRQRARARPARSARARRGAPADAPPIVPVDRTPADLQAIATVIGRRRHSEDPSDKRLDMHEVDLRYVRWANAHLERAYLSGAYLEGADLSGANLAGALLVGAHLQGYLREVHLEGAYLVGAQLKGAYLVEAHMQGAYLLAANLEGANLSEAHLEGAHLSGAHLEGADLSGAYLEGADFSETRLEGAADLSGADLSGARLGEADLRGADLTDVKGLTWPQLEAARNVDQARLPDDLIDELQEQAAAGPVEEETAG
jgi:23S rRNA pseudoU1915 N3-methylase RlmH